MTDLYAYSLLDANSIRLLYLAPREAGNSGSCKIRTFSLEDLPSFEALSYTWGTPELTHEVLVDGKKLPITQNLAGALASIRHESEVRVLWIDAISINQMDLNERTQQVQLMASIYSRARQVLIYLGAMTSDVPEAMELLVKMFNLALQENRDQEAGGALLTEVRYPSATDNEKWGLPSFGASEWDSLAQFFSRPWFKRVWIVQEVRAALNAQILIGDSLVPWIYIFVASSWFNHHNYKYVAGQGRFAGHVGVASLPSRIGCHRLAEANSFRVPLSDILRKMRPNYATDPRDKVFAFIGLAIEGQENDSRLRPDYSKTMAEVYRDVSRYLIEVGNSLEILSAVCWVPDVRSPLTWAETDIPFEDGTLTQTTPVWGPVDESIIFPSWVPRWDCPDIAFPLATRHRNFFRASGNLRLRSLPSPDRNVLTLGGLSLDRTRRQSETLSDKFDPELVGATMEVLRNMAANEAIFYSDDHRIDNFYLTLTAGLMSDNKEAAGNSQYQQNLEAFLAKLSLPGRDDTASNVRDVLNESGATLDLTTVETASQKADISQSSKEVDGPAELVGDPGIYFRLVDEKCDRRRFFITEKGYMGLGPEGMLPGDTVCILFGGDTPYVVRKIEESWKFIGECYMHGVMQGEAVEGLRDDVEAEVFEIL